VELEERTALGSVGPEWDALVDAMDLPSPFLRSWWVDHAAVGDPVIVCCRDRGVLVGGLALQRTNRYGVEWLEMLGDGALEPDHLDLVADPGHATQVGAILGEWLGRRGSRVLDLRGLAAGAHLIAHIPGVGPTHRLEVAPYLRLPGSYDQLLAQLPGKLRSTITRTGKRLDKAGVVTRVRDAGDVDEALAALRELHDDRWGSSSGFMSGWEQFEAAARAGVSIGDVWFTELVDAEGRVVATEVDLWSGSRVAFYQAGRLGDHELRGSGSALKARILERAIERGATEFDLLRGDESYKAEWATARRDLVAVRKGVGPAGVALMAVAEANRVYQDRSAARASSPAS
jgi:CelD/BcsL family acetyltransferase involved in cellulose biosynthesis